MVECGWLKEDIVIICFMVLLFWIKLINIIVFLLLICNRDYLEICIVGFVCLFIMY